METTRIRLFSFLHELKNIVAEEALSDGPSEYDVADFSEKVLFLISSIEAILPMVQAMEEFINYDIGDQLFMRKWVTAINAAGASDLIDMQEIGPEVSGFLDKYNNDTYEGE